jgi:hypothetical protein
MACQIVRVNGAVFCVWGKPELSDVDQVLGAIHSASREARAPIVYVTRVPPGAPAPEGATRKRLDEILPTLIGHLRSYHVVLEGEGFVSAFKRGVLTSLLQPFWRKRMFFVHATCADVCSKLAPDELEAVDNVLKLAQIHGLTTGFTLSGRPTS